MNDYGAMIRSTFEMGSVRDAGILFEALVKNAFPTMDFRHLELIRFNREAPYYIEGRSWNHVFEIRADTLNGNAVWNIRCRRVTMGKTPDKQAFLDYMTLNFLLYQ